MMLGKVCTRWLPRLPTAMVVVPRGFASASPTSCKTSFSDSGDGPDSVNSAVTSHAAYTTSPLPSTLPTHPPQTDTSLKTLHGRPLPSHLVGCVTRASLPWEKMCWCSFRLLWMNSKRTEDCAVNVKTTHTRLILVEDAGSSPSHSHPCCFN